MQTYTPPHCFYCNNLIIQTAVRSNPLDNLEFLICALDQLVNAINGDVQAACYPFIVKGLRQTLRSAISAILNTLYILQ